jgi:hypothetical protein
MNFALAVGLYFGLLGIDQQPVVLVVVGAPGNPEYEKGFNQWTEKWCLAAKKGKAQFSSIGLDSESKENDRQRLEKFLSSQPTLGSAPLWVVLIGHGTDDGREARFNLRGPDITPQELAAWLKPIKRPVAVINCASSSATFINHLSDKNRVVVTATRSGHESNYARFGQYMAETISDLNADLDKDGQVSLLEAFLTTSSRVNEFYRSEARLSTEHSLIDDNGDKLGSPADWFQGTRAVKRAKEGSVVDGLRAHQWHLIPSDQERSIPLALRQRRDELELSLANLRDQKTTLKEEEYYSRLEKIMVELARLYQNSNDSR